MCFFYLLLLYVICVCFEADHGVVAEGGIAMQYLEDGGTPVNTRPLETAWLDDSYTQFSECSHEHKFESITETTNKKGIKSEHRSQHRHGFFLQCVQSVPAQDAYLFVFFNALPIDRLIVTSCNKDDVQKSIFPPRADYVMNHRYGEVYEDKNDGYVLSIYLVYKDVSGEYYQRLYSVRYDKTQRRFELKDRKGKTSFGGADCCHVKFNCQTPLTELKSIVTGVADPERKAPLSLDLISEPDTTKQLVCTVPLPGPENSDFSYELICVKTQKTPEGQQGIESSGDKFVAFVNYGSSNAFPLERFTVKSCIEDDIVRSIFPGRLQDPESSFPLILFKQADGKCYGHLHHGKESAYAVKWHYEQTCPSKVLGWVHPLFTTGAVMWLSCQGPMSASGEPKTLP